LMLAIKSIFVSATKTLLFAAANEYVLQRLRCKALFDAVL